MARARGVFLLVLSVCLLTPPSFSDQAAEEKKVARETWYSCRSEELDVAGYLHVTRTASDDESAPVLLRYEIVAVVEGKELRASVETLCKDDEHLTPVKVDVRGTGGIVRRISVAIQWPPENDQGAGGLPGFSDGRLTGTMQGEAVARAIPPYTVTDMTVLEIVRRLPTEKDTSLEFNILDVSNLRLRQDQRLLYAGRDEIEIGGRRRKLHKFEYRAELETKAEYWVDENHELVRFVSEGRDEFVLTSEEEAKKPLRKGSQGPER